MGNTVSEKASDLELFHYGIKGMKWGVRRKEGSDGTVSSAVKRRKVGEEDSEEYTRTRALKKNSTRTLSNAELQDVVTRMNLEQQYSRLNPKPTSKGKKVVTDILANTGKQLASEMLKQGAKQGGEALKTALKNR